MEGANLKTLLVAVLQNKETIHSPEGNEEEREKTASWSLWGPMFLGRLYL